MYCGISYAWVGSRIVLNISANQNHLRRKRRRAKAEAAIEQAIRSPTMAKKQMTKELTKKRPKVLSPKRVQPVR